MIEKIIEGATMEIPDAMLDTQARQMLDEYAQRLAYQGMSMEQYMQFSGATPQGLLEQMKPQALKRIQSRLVLEAVAKAENIEISEEEMNEEMKKMAEQYKMEVEKVEEILDDASRKQMREDLAIQKAVDLVREAAVEK